MGERRTTGVFECVRECRGTEAWGGKRWEGGQNDEEFPG